MVGEIGGFTDEKKSKKLVLTEEEHRNYDKWNFISKRSYQEEVVHFLTFEEREVWTYVYVYMITLYVI
jgi:hypothetical protein